MPNSYFATGDPGKGFTWDDARAFPLSFAAGRGVVTTRYAKTSLPAVHGVDVGAELEAIHRVLVGLHADDAILIRIALDEARHQLQKPEPDIDRIGAAVQRALDFASRDDGFDDRLEALAPPLRRLAAWLGGPWHRLLGFVNLTF
jgi:hypothetical protein